MVVLSGVYITIVIRDFLSFKLHSVAYRFFEFVCFGRDNEFGHGLHGWRHAD
jgi:hypothetical protein